MAEVPKFAIPFQFGSQGARTVEQDSIEEIGQCVEAILRTPRGSREIDPNFGVPDITFARPGVSQAEIERAIQEQEPRVSALVEEQPDLLDVLIDHVTVHYSEVQNG